MSLSLWVEVEGKPAAKGSVAAFPIQRKGGKMGAVVVHSSQSKAWEATIRKELVGQRAIKGPVAVTLWFFLPRPKSVKRKKRLYPSVIPDSDKLARAVCDALKGIIDDDSRVIDLEVYKRYADEFPVGVFIHVREKVEGEEELAVEVAILRDIQQRERAKCGAIGGS